MERTNHWAALYFIILMTFGNYVLFNLLVAILVEGFKCQVWKEANIIRAFDTLCPFQNDLFVECFSEDEDDFYTDSNDDEDLDHNGDEADNFCSDKRGISFLPCML